MQRTIVRCSSKFGPTCLLVTDREISSFAGARLKSRALVHKCSIAPEARPSLLSIMSPTCTIPYEVLFEFVNDTMHPATMQVLRREDGSRTGATILMHRGENISLVLTAGAPYKYAVKMFGREFNLSVKVWQDTRCQLSGVYAASRPTALHGESASKVVADGVAIVEQTRTWTD